MLLQGLKRTSRLVKDMNTSCHRCKKLRKFTQFFDGALTIVGRHDVDHASHGSLILSTNLYPYLKSFDTARDCVDPQSFQSDASKRPLQEYHEQLKWPEDPP